MRVLGNGARRSLDTGNRLHSLALGLLALLLPAMSIGDGVEARWRLVDYSAASGTAVIADELGQMLQLSEGDWAAGSQWRVLAVSSHYVHLQAGGQEFRGAEAIVRRGDFLPSPQAATTTVPVLYDSISVVVELDKGATQDTSIDESEEGL